MPIISFMKTTTTPAGWAVQSRQLTSCNAAVNFTGLMPCVECTGQLINTGKKNSATTQRMQSAMRTIWGLYCTSFPATALMYLCKVRASAMRATCLSCPLIGCQKAQPETPHRDIISKTQNTTVLAAAGPHTTTRRPGPS